MSQLGPLKPLELVTIWLDVYDTEELHPTRRITKAPT